MNQPYHTQFTLKRVSGIVPILYLYLVVMCGNVCAQNTDQKTTNSDLEQSSITLDFYCSVYDRHVTTYEKLFSTFEAEFDKLLNIRFYYIDHQCAGNNDRCSEFAVRTCLFEIGFPELIAYSTCRHKQIPGSPWQECIKLTGLPRKRLDTCITSETIPAILKKNMSFIEKQSEHLPLLFVDGDLYQDQITEVKLRAFLCKKLSGKTASACQQVAECFNNVDCYQKGWISLCEEAGTNKAKCVYIEPIEVPMTLIIPEPGYFSNYQGIMELNYRNFPGIIPHTISEHSVEAQDFIKEYSISVLPAYIFDPIIEETYYFNVYREAFYRSNDRLLFSPDRVGATIFCNRVRKPGHISVFVNSHSQYAMTMLHDYYKNNSENKDAISLSVYYVFILSEENEATAYRGKAEFEENIRQSVILNNYPKSFSRYLQLWVENFETTYWQELVKQAGLDPVIIKKAATGEAGKKILHKNLEAIKDLPLGPDNDIIMMLENRELYIPREQDSIISIIKKMEALTTNNKHLSQ